MLTKGDRDWLGKRSSGLLTLGWEVGAWIQEHCVIPDGDQAGQPFMLSRPQWWFILKHYELRSDVRKTWAAHKSGRAGARTMMAFRYRRSQLVRSQKWGKGPLASGMICGEAAGPVVFDGFDSDGQPVGRPWPTPWIQVVALAGDQTDNIWSALVPMIELGPLSEILHDTGLSRIVLPGDHGTSGKIEPVTSAEGTRLGQRITFAVHDQTESWTEDSMHRVASVQRRNLAGMGGRLIETPNAWDPSEASVAKETCEAGLGDVYIDFPKTPEGSVKNKRERRKALRFAYDGAPWVDLERIDAEVAELAVSDPGQAERWYLNRIVAGADVAFAPEIFEPLFGGKRVKAKRKITVGFDGSRRLDATGVVCCDIETGQLWAEGGWERPPGLRPDDDSWSIDVVEVGNVVDYVFEEYDVWRMYGDPPGYREEMAHWAARHGADRVVEWWTDRPKAMAYAVREFHSDMSAAAGVEAAVPTIAGHGTMSFGAEDDRLDDMLMRHLRNAVRRATRMRDDNDTWLWTVAKDGQKSSRKIDLAMCAILAWQARLDAIRAGVLVKKKYGRAAW